MGEPGIKLKKKEPVPYQKRVPAKTFRQLHQGGRGPPRTTKRAWGGGEGGAEKRIGWEFSKNNK